MFNLGIVKMQSRDYDDAGHVVRQWWINFEGQKKITMWEQRQDKITQEWYWRQQSVNP